MSCYLTPGNEGNPSAWFDWTRQWNNSWSEEGTDGNISFNVTELDMDDSYTCLPENIHGMGHGDSGGIQICESRARRGGDRSGYRIPRSVTTSLGCE